MSITYPHESTMQPAALPCVFDTEEFADFESAHQFSITSEDWTLTELDEAALGIEQKPTGVAGGVRLEPEGANRKTSAAAVAGGVASSRGAVAGGMKTSMLDANGEDELFGSSNTRNYNTAFNKTRPTMISAKYRLKEERRKVLKISINKLKKIEDPESSLRRSVLINNTMKRLQKEAREERREKQQIHSFPRYSPSYKSFVLREEPPKPVEESKPATESPPTTPRLKPDANKENASPYPSERKHPPKGTLEACFCEETMDELVDVTTLDDELSRPLEELANPANLMESASIDDVAARCASRKRSFDEDLVRPLDALLETPVVESVGEVPSLDASQVDKVRVEPMEVTPAARKRSYEEVEDSEIHDVLSQFYMPPTPRMLTSIDDDEDEEVNVVDIDTIDIPIERPLPQGVVDAKLLGFDELVRQDLDEAVTPLAKHASFDLMGDDAADADASPCKRARFEASPLAVAEPVVAVAAPYENMTPPNDLQPKIARPFESSSSDTKSTPRYGYLSVCESSGDLPRTSRASAEVGSHNCGTVSNSLAAPSDECGAATPTPTPPASSAPCARIDAEIKDMKSVDFVTKENCKMVDRRSQISRISERMSWTSLMHDSRTDAQEYKLYNNGLCKTLADCCYQETNNNLAAEARKYSCAHAAITELQSQVYHNYVTSLES